MCWIAHQHDKITIACLNLLDRGLARRKTRSSVVIVFVCLLEERTLSIDLWLAQATAELKPGIFTWISSLLCNHHYLLPLGKRFYREVEQRGSSLT